MHKLLKEIREYLGISQQDFANELNVSFATINRWENGHSEPNKSMQVQLYGYCEQHNVPLYDMIINKILEIASSIQLESDRILLYHGSKSGINGAIAPISREQCDFGQGFYMGTESGQALTLICDFPKSKFYIVSVRTEGLSQINVPADIDWAMLVAYYRGRMEHARGTAFYEKYARFTADKDLAIGSIANDRMFYVLDNFFENLISEMALVKSLSALKLGQQYVMITQKGCDAVRIEAEVKLSQLERKCLQVVSQENRTKGINMAKEICKNYRREGRFFDEILNDAMKGGC